MVIDFKSPKKWSYPINLVLFNLCRLWPFRNKRIWIFGAREGHQYEDNSRFLFEYLNAQTDLSKLRLIWLTNSNDVVNKVRGLGFEAHLNSSFYAKWLELRAGVAIYTNALIDFGVFPLIGGAEIVCLWHGVGFKKAYNAKYANFEVTIKKSLDHVFSWTYRTMTTATSQWTIDWFKSIFTLNPNNIYITGQPRNDTLHNISREKVLTQLGIDSDKRIILYLPTYRQPRLGANAMKRILWDLYVNQDLDNVLKDTNSIFVAKLHPLTPHVNFANRENFRILNYDEIENNQELLAVGDVLVTDYSSTFVDFSLLNRPIIFYAPDEKDFLSKSEQLFEKFWDLQTLNKAVTPKGLSEKILYPSNIVCSATNEIFEDESIRGTCYSENVYNVICKKIGI